MPPKHVRSCNGCSQPDKPVVHQYKTIHLRLDSSGDTFVSQEIAELLRKVPTMAGLQVVPGLNAPPQAIGAVEPGPNSVILAGREFYIPASTKNDAVARMRKPFQPYVEAVREEIDRAATAKKMEKAKTFIFGKRTK